MLPSSALSHIDVDAAFEGQFGQSDSNFSEFRIGHIGRRRCEVDFRLGHVVHPAAQKSVFYRRQTLPYFRQKLASVWLSRSSASSKVIFGMNVSESCFLDFIRNITIFERRAVIDRPYREVDDIYWEPDNAVMLGMDI